MMFHAPVRPQDDEPDAVLDNTVHGERAGKIAACVAVPGLLLFFMAIRSWKEKAE